MNSQAIGVGPSHSSRPARHREATSATSSAGSRIDAIKSARAMQAMLITVSVVAVLAALVATFGASALVPVLVMVPAPLALLWLSSGVVRADE